MSRTLEHDLREIELAAIADYRLTDDALAQRFAEEHGDDLRYVGPWRRWILYNGTRWLPDECGGAVNRLRDTLRSLLIGCVNNQEDDEKTSERRMRAIFRCLRGSRLQEILGVARWEPGIAILPQLLDGDPWLLNVSNGTLDLRTGKLRPHDRADFITKIAPVDYAPDATCPTFDGFMSRIMGGNEALIGYIQRSFGYALTGDTREQLLFMLYGTGANGKSTLLNTLLDLLGDYAMQAAPDLLMARRDDTHPTGIADLAGRRMVATIEVDEGRRLAESLVKAMTGGDRIRARRMRQDNFEFNPTHKLFLAANHRPVIRGTDHAIWRRIHLIPFGVTIPPEEQDHELPSRLHTELPGILRWAVEGCRLWLEHGLRPPGEVVAATSEYRAAMDTLADFITSTCYVGNGASVSKKAMYAGYREWTERNGERVMSQREFSQRLQERGFAGDKWKHGYRGHFWTGIGLLEDASSSHEINGQDATHATDATQLPA